MSEIPDDDYEDEDHSYPWGEDTVTRDLYEILLTTLLALTAIGAFILLFGMIAIIPEADAQLAPGGGEGPSTGDGNVLDVTLEDPLAECIIVSIAILVASWALLRHEMRRKKKRKKCSKYRKWRKRQWCRIKKWFSWLRYLVPIFGMIFGIALMVACIYVALG